MTPQCQQMQDDLKAYHDGELPLLQRLAVRRHLARCAACREEMRIMEQIGQQLQAAEDQPEATLKPALREKILTAIPTENVATKPPVRPEYSGAPPWYRNLWFHSGAVVTAALLFIVVAPLFSRSRENARRASSTSSLREFQLNKEYADSAASSGAPAASSVAPASKPVNQPQAGAFKRVAPSMPDAAYDTTPEYSGGADTSNVPSSLRRVHQEARIAVEVADLEDKSNIVIALVKSADGFVANNTLTTGTDGLKTASLSVKVPVGKFETVLSQIGKLGEVKAKNISGEDITEQFSDAQQADNVMANELAIKEAQLKAAMLKAEAAEKAKKPIPDTWQLRSEVRRLRIEAAQTRARMELLKKISDLANISVELREKPRTASEGGFVQQMSDTSRAAMDSFLLAARLPITLLIWILAYAPLWLPALLIYRFALRVYQKKVP